MKEKKYKRFIFTTLINVDIMKSTETFYHETFRDIPRKEGVTSDQIFNFNIFLSKNDAGLDFNLSVNVNVLKARKEKNENYKPSTPSECSSF